MHFRVISFFIFFMMSTIFAQNSSKLHLTSGDFIECNTFQQVFTTQLFCYLCNGDTIKSKFIHGMTDTAGYHPFFQDAFLSRTIDGKVSIYTGNVPSIEISNQSGIKSGLSVEPVFHKKTFYTFDDSVFYEFQHFRGNHPLVETFKSHPDASRFYTGYRLCNTTSIIGIGTSILPLIGGLIALSDHHAEKGVTLLVTSAFGFTISTVIRGVIGKRCLNRSIVIFNKF